LSSKNGGGEVKFETVKELDDEKFRRLAGVKRTTFDKMVLILEQSSKDKKINGGRKNKLSIANMLLMTLEYIREYRTYFHISQSYGVSESTAYKTVRWIEDTLIKHPDFALPGRKALLKSDVEYEVVLIDATETPIERPKKAKALLFREEEKAHSEEPGGRGQEKPTNLCTAFANGKRHDFRLFKESKTQIHPTIGVVTDTGYQGLQKIHVKTHMPKKRSKKRPLTREDKRNNQELSRERVANENVIGSLKRFKILSDR
jgi:hypothetical protein